MNSRLIVVSYSLRDGAFHRESLLEYTQGNALRMLKNHEAPYHAIAIVETNEDADRVMAEFSRMQRIARGEEEPLQMRLRPAVPAADMG